MSSSDYIAHAHLALHESPFIADCICNGCLRLEVLDKQTRTGCTERYYCKHAQHGYFDPRKVDDCKMAIHSTEGICKSPGRGIILDAYGC